MNTTKMSKAEIADYLTTTLGQEVDPDATIQQLRSQVSLVLGAVDTPAPVAPVVKGLDMEERVEVIIAKDSRDKYPVYLAVNGDDVLINRGHRVSVKRKFIEVLENAKTVSWDSEMKEFQEVHTYPFQVFG